MGVTVADKFLENLVSKGLLTKEQYETIQEDRRTKSAIQVAEDLLSILTELPAPSFDNFCEVLGQTEGGNELLQLLQSPPSPSATKTDVEEDGGLVTAEEKAPASAPGTAEAVPAAVAAAQGDKQENQSSSGDSGHKRGFPHDDDEITKDLIRAVSSAGADQWQKICSFLLNARAVREIRELSDDSTVRLMYVIERWEQSTEVPTVRKLIKVCKECDVSRRRIKQTYDNLFTSA
eukprot:m.96109 g.96109  ORF g.96109 m.96109 type:complete len:234 (+) comp36889_c0_seq4:101-802(+)